MISQFLDFVSVICQYGLIKRIMSKKFRKNKKKTFSELNEKINSISFRDPTKLNPWRHFNKKRKLEDDQDFIKNPRPVKKIILQPRITNTRVRKGFDWFFYNYSLIGQLQSANEIRPKVHQKALLELFDIGAQTKPSHLFVNSINLKTESSLSHHFIESLVYESYL